MTETKNLPSVPIITSSLIKAMLLGAAPALILISIFLSGNYKPDPNWPKLWMVRPLVVVPLAGAVGGAFFHLITQRYQSGPMKIIAIIISVLIYIIGLWLGIVLGLDGTMWD